MTDEQMENQRSAALITYILALTQFTSTFMYSGVGIALPVMGKELQASGVQLGLVEMMYMGTASAFLLPFGRFADLTDRVLLFKVGLTLYAACTLMIGMMSAIVPIIGIRLLQGFSAALIMSTNMAILTQIVPKQELGKAFGISVGAVYVGLSAGPFVAGWITDRFGWRWVFISTFFVLLLAYILIQFTLKANWKRPTASYDWPGAVVIVTAIFLLLGGSTQLSKSALGWVICGLGVVMIGLFFTIEKRSKLPLLDLRILTGNSTLSIALGIQLLAYVGALANSFLFSIYLQIIKGYSSQTAGQILIISPAIMAVLAPVFGRLADRFSPKILSSVGMFFIFAGIAAAVGVTRDTGIGYLILVLTLQGVGFGIFASPNMTTIMSSVEPRYLGITSALAAKLRTLGMVFSMMIVTIFMSFYLGSGMIDHHPAEYLNAMQGSFIVFTVFVCFGVIISMKPIRKEVLPG